MSNADLIERLKWRAENTNNPQVSTPTLCREAVLALIAADARIVEITRRAEFAEARAVDAEMELRAQRHSYLIQEQERLTAVRQLAEAMEALKQAEACMSIVEPRSDKAEYLRILGEIRAALANLPAPAPKGDE